jgi:ABC-2 type transport system ATP-binding protein
VTTATGTPIVIRGLRKRYGPIWALKGVDLAVGRGEVFAVLGPNGAGKTTLVEIASGVRRATSGEVRVLGYDPAQDSRAWRARIGVVPQRPGAFADLTVREVVRHFATMYPTPLPVDRVLTLVGLAAQAGQLTGTLSGGQQRRLDIAVGIVGDPELIFLDEPTTGLDPVARRGMWELVRGFAAEGKTTVLTTHYLDEVEALAGRAAVIVGGLVVETGAVRDLGGDATRTTTISFSRTGGLAGRPLPGRLGPTVDPLDCAPDGLVRLHTREPTAVLDALIAWAHAFDVDELPGIQVHRPTLEEVYLRLIRDHERADGPGAPDRPEGTVR